MATEPKMLVVALNDLQSFKDSFAEQLYGKTEPGCCVQCKRPFTSLNVYTEAGWRETKISKMCECCWDHLFSSKE